MGSFNRGVGIPGRRLHPPCEQIGAVRGLNEVSNVNGPLAKGNMRKDFDVSHPTSEYVGGNILRPSRCWGRALLGVCSPPTSAYREESYMVIMKWNPISFAKPVSVSPEQDICLVYMCLSSIHVFQGATAAGGTGGSPRHTDNVKLSAPLANEEVLGHEIVVQVARWDQRIRVMEGEKKNLETLLEAEADMRKAAEVRMQKLSQVTGEVKYKARVLKCLKIEKDERLSAGQCAEMDSRLMPLHRQMFAKWCPAGSQKAAMRTEVWGWSRESKLDWRWSKVSLIPECRGQVYSDQSGIGVLVSVIPRIPQGLVILLA
ncbi:hypothetical protein Tco_0388915 [Tanacetum coccineum]